MNKQIGKIESYEKALKTFKVLIKSNPTDVERDAAIQRFEYTFQLAWTSLKETLKVEGISSEKLASPKKVLKEGFLANFINKEEIWIEILQDRNLTSHSYNEQIAQNIYNDFNKYYPEMESLLILLKKNLD